MSLTEEIKDFLLSQGAIAVGVATAETLKGGPPSVDLEYRLPGARSAISFALPMDRDRIKAFLAKKKRPPHEEDNVGTNIRATTLSWESAEKLSREGYEVKGTAANLKYRTEIKGW